MKSKVLLVLLFGLSSFAHSQNKKFSLSTNLLNLAVSGPSVSLSYRCSPKLAFQIYGSSGNFDRFLSHSRYQFKTTILDVKYSFTQDFYIGPYLRYIDKKVQREGFLDNTGFVAIGDRDFHGQGIASGLSLGMQVHNFSFLNLEAFAGAGYGKFISQRNYSGQGKQTGFLDARIGILAGLKF